MAAESIHEYANGWGSAIVDADVGAADAINANAERTGHAKPPNLVTYDKKPDNSLTTGATVLCKLPEVRIQQIIEGIDSRLDTTLTGELDRRILAMIIQILCGMRPNRKVRPLQCATYEDLARKMQLAAQRVRSKEGHDRMENATVLMVNSSCSKEMITKLATEFNWEEGNWIQTLSKKQKEALELEGDGDQQTTLDSCPFKALPLEDGSAPVTSLLPLEDGPAPVTSPPPHAEPMTNIAKQLAAEIEPMFSDNSNNDIDFNEVNEVIAQALAQRRAKKAQHSLSNITKHNKQLLSYFGKPLHDEVLS